MPIILKSRMEDDRRENLPHSINRICSYTNSAFVEEHNTSKINNISEKTTVMFVKNPEKEPKVSIFSESKEYEPYDYCTSEKPTTYCDTLLHLLKAAVGTGILAIPNAFKDVGYVVGISGIVFIAVLYTYCMHLLVKSEYELCKRRRVPNMSYANTVHAAFEETLPKYHWLASGGKFFANFFFMVYESGGCAIYIIFISSNLKQLLDYYLHDDINLRIIMLYVTLPIILICWIRNLKLLAPLSAVANIILFICFILVFWYMFRETPTFEGKQAVAVLSKIPVYLTTILFATACTGIVLPLKSEMKYPSKFASPSGVLNIAIIPMTLLYAVFGFFGYLKYGNDVAGSISLNLPQNELIAQTIKGLYSLSIFISYHLCYYVVLDVVWKNYLKNKCKKNNIFWEYIIRTLIPIVTFLMAYAISNLETFISLVGALGISTTSLVIPIVVHTLVYWNYYKTKLEFYIFFLKNMILLCISIVIFVTGITESIIDIIQLYLK
ncbi:hypothetical protein PGB90_009793 [Kerria lacca]